MGAASGTRTGAATHEQSARNARGSVPRLARAFQPACSTAAASTSASAPPVIGVGGHVGAPHVHKSRTRGNVQLGEGGGERLHHARHVARGERAHIGDAEGVGAQIALSRVDDVDRKSTRLNSSHTVISYAVFCLKKKKE